MKCHPPYGRVAILRDRTKHGRVALPRDRHGSVLMEFLLVFPIIMLLVSMLLQFAQIWIARQITAYAAYCATRATLTANDSEQVFAAEEAARSVCAWMVSRDFPPMRSALFPRKQLIPIGRSTTS